MVLTQVLTEAARLAWEHDYIGSYHATMLKSINAMERCYTLANCITVVQSSGCGKSRMVDEMAKLVFTIPINVRNPREGRRECCLHLVYDGANHCYAQLEGAYPPQDTRVWQYFCESEIRDENHAECLAILFFQNLFSEANAEVKRVFFGKQSPYQFAQTWRNHLSDYRHAFYSNIIKACQKVGLMSLLFSPKMLTPILLE